MVQEKIDKSAKNYVRPTIDNSKKASNNVIIKENDN